MARITQVTRESVKAELRDTFDLVTAGPSGVGTGPMSVLVHSPEMARRARPLFNYVRNESSVPKKTPGIGYDNHCPSDGLSLYLECSCWVCS